MSLGHLHHHPHHHDAAGAPEPDPNASAHAHDDEPTPDHAPDPDPDHHGHGHGLGHHHGPAPIRHPGRRGLDRRGERRRLVLSLSLTVIILVAEVVGGLASRSLALLSDAGHMLSDVAAQALSLVALVLAARPADARRTWGYYRIEILAALANGVTLIGLAAWIVWSGYQRLRHGAPPIDLPVMMGVAAIGLLANLGGAWILRPAKSLNARGAYLHLLTDTLSSVAVLAGGAAMWLVGGLWMIDPILSMAIGLFVTYSAFRLVRDAVDVLLEAVPVDVDLAGVASALAGVAGVQAVHDLHIWTITSGMRALSAHLVVARAELGQSDRVLAAVHALLERSFRITHSTIQIECGDRDCQGCPPLSR